MDNNTAIKVLSGMFTGLASEQEANALEHAIQAIEALERVRGQIQALRADAAATEYKGLASLYRQQADLLAKAIGDATTETQEG